MKAPPAPGIDDKVAFLAEASAYPAYTGSVTVVETHLSWVFLTDTRAYKLKKPVCHRHLDFSDLAARHRNCLEEVRLNRRLGGDTYLGILAVSFDERDRLLLGPGHTLVDWLVVMRRLPEAAMLSRQIETDSVDEAALVRAAARLARFYQAADPIALGPTQYLDLLRGHIAANQRDLAGTWSRYRQIQELQLSLLAAQPELLRERARRGMIVEVHGDLRPEHVCLVDPPVFIDCLEFSRALRTQDRVDELAFLAMECEKMGAPAIGALLFETYQRVTGDTPAPQLRHFYASLRAAVRARLCVWHAQDIPERQRPVWQQKAADYLELAENHARRLRH